MAFPAVLSVVLAILFGNFRKLEKFTSLAFPIRATCDLTLFPGTINSAICILPMNVIYSYVFPIIWFWYFAQLILLIGNTLFFCINYKTNIKNKVLAYCLDKQVGGYVKKSDFATTFVLYLITENVGSEKFAHLVSHLNKNQKKNRLE